jgi:hypothetical protein
MPEFIPGPWTLTRNGDLLGPDGEKLLLTGVRLLMGGTPAEKAEAAANTRLLWAAPELMEALIDLVVEIEELKGIAWCEDETHLKTAIDRGRATVVKAKGESHA